MHRGLVEPEAVRRLVLAELGPLPLQPVPLLEVHGLVLAEAVEATFDVPRSDNSAMDGFAVRSADTACPPTVLRVVGRSLAGVSSDLSIGPGEAVAIATGAMMPAGADAVAPLEEVGVDGVDLVVRTPVPPGRHVRRGGRT
jgi:molybdopterin molybdotransferase